MRIRCNLLGCSPDDDGMCVRCGEDYWPLCYALHKRVWWKFRRWLRGLRCLECRRWLWRTGQYEKSGCCSKKCFNAWIPF